jgi:hypothetical protein
MTIRHRHQGKTLTTICEIFDAIERECAVIEDIQAENATMNGPQDQNLDRGETNRALYEIGVLIDIGRLMGEAMEKGLTKKRVRINALVDELESCEQSVPAFNT